LYCHHVKFCVFVYRYRGHRDLRSFPTRRSSDLQGNLDPMVLFGGDAAIRSQARKVIDDFGTVGKGGHVFNLGHGISRFTPPDARSEEHTSELQSRENLVCRLLLEKKNAVRHALW